MRASCCNNWWRSAPCGRAHIPPHARDALATLQKLAHDLDVSASMPGAPGLAEPARELEAALYSLLQAGAARSANTVDALGPLVTADLARYRAKDNGRNRVEWWTGPLTPADPAS